MVELPRHVHRVTKARKRRPPVVYTFYTRHRNTPEAWPSIALPDPLSAEFAPRVAICEALERYEDGFRLHAASLPSHKTKEFWPAAEKLHKAKVRRAHSDAKDFTALVEDFKAHEAYDKLEPSTKRGYDRSADMVLAAWAMDLPSELTTVDAQQAIDALGDTPATANQFRAYLSRLVAWGVPRGFCKDNPVAFTEKIPGGVPWDPWPDWAFETFFELAPFNLLLPAISSLFTGQRQSDVLRMQRPRKNETVMEVSAQKTKNTVWIPIHSEYRRWIDQAEELAAEDAKRRQKDGEALMASTMLHLGVRGRPYQTTGGFRSEWGKLMKTEPFKRFVDERIVFHGLRKNAVINLLEVGCTESQAGAIANMSEQMVRHYGREVSSRALARDGMKLLESRWSEVRPAVLEQEQNGNWKPSVRIGNRWTPSRRGEPT